MILQKTVHKYYESFISSFKLFSGKPLRDMYLKQTVNASLTASLDTFMFGMRS